MSPKEAPESLDPYFDSASFSSCISNSLIERLIFLVFESNEMITESIFSPIANLSVFCSFLSLDKFILLIYPNIFLRHQKFHFHQAIISLDLNLLVKLRLINFASPNKDQHHNLY